MITKKLVALPLLLTGFLFLFNSCDRKCTGCSQLESCDKGQCVCLQGLEGPNCDSLSRNKFIGEYTVSESYNPPLNGQSSATYQCDIDSSTVAFDQVYFDNLLNQGIEAYADINTIYIVIPDQTLNGGIEIQSNQGTFSTIYRNFTLTYQVNGGSVSSVVTANFQHL